MLWLKFGRQTPDPRMAIATMICRMSYKYHGPVASSNVQNSDHSRGAIQEPLLPCRRNLHFPWRRRSIAIRRNWNSKSRDGMEKLVDTTGSSISTAGVTCANGFIQIFGYRNDRQPRLHHPQSHQPQFPFLKVPVISQCPNLPGRMNLTLLDDTIAALEQCRNGTTGSFGSLNVTVQNPPSLPPQNTTTNSTIE